MAIYPNFSKKQLDKIGKSLREELPWDENDPNAFAEVFHVMHSWRASHFLPMRAIRQEATRFVRPISPHLLSMGRLKRMASIRTKLRRLTTTKLSQIQDLGGARIVLNNRQEINQVLDLYRNGRSRHNFIRERDYINFPQKSGYRGHHIILKYQGRKTDGANSGRLIELQIRTLGQHLWATAVEGVGLYLGEDLKAGKGDKRWLRFFELFSEEIEEEDPAHEKPEHSKIVNRRKEIRALNAELSILATLRSLKEGFRHIGQSRFQGSKAIMLRFDKEQKLTMIDRFSVTTDAAEKYSQQEIAFQRVNSVLIDLDKATSLLEAYPNYFLNVELFAGRVGGVIKGYNNWELRRYFFGDHHV